MHFTDKKLKIEDRAKAVIDALNDLEQAEAAEPALKRGLVLAQHGDGNLGAAKSRLAANDEAVTSGRTLLQMRRMDLLEHINDAIDAQLAELPDREAELAKNERLMQAELEKMVPRVECLAGLLGGQWRDLNNALQEIRNDPKRILPTAPGEFSDAIKLFNERQHIRSLQKTDDLKTLVNDRYIRATKAAGRGEAPPATKWLRRRPDQAA